MNRVQILIIIIACGMLVTIPVVCANKGDIKLVTEPEDVMVTVDGAQAGRTPITIPDLSYGDHTFLLTKAGYEDVTKTIKVKNPSKTLKYSLEPVMGVIRISSVPSPSTVYLNDKKMDKQTPVTLVVPQGSHVVALTKEGYKRYETNVEVQKGEEKIIEAELKKEADAAQPADGKVIARINTVPQGARVLIDGEETGKVTPASCEVLPGDHMITLNMPGYENYHEEIKFPEESPLKVNLVPRTEGTIQVITTPADAEISLDGTVKGRQSPLLIENVGYGEHTLDVRRAGYEAESRKIQVNFDNREFSVNLKAKSGVIRVNSIPTDSIVFKNGVPLDTNTPVTLLVEPGEYSIAVGRNAIPVEVQKVTVGLGEEKTLNYVLDGPQGEVLKNDDGTITVGINTDPEGASITIDDKSYEEKTPAFITLRPGNHQVKLSLLKYQTYLEDIKFPDESPLKVEMHEAATDYPDVSQGTPAPVEEKVDFSIATTPPGATVTITGEKGNKTGITPVTFNVLPGSWDVKARLEGYKEYSKTVSVGKNGKSLDLELEGSSSSIVPEQPGSSGVIMIVSDPSGAVVSIGGQNKGVTPFASDAMVPGSYDCTLSLSGYDETTHQITVKSGTGISYGVTMATGEWVESQMLSSPA